VCGREYSRRFISFSLCHAAISSFFFGMRRKFVDIPKPGAEVLFGRVHYQGLSGPQGPISVYR
jgi:hypothetical protein